MNPSIGTHVERARLAGIQEPLYVLQGTELGCRSGKPCLMVQCGIDIVVARMNVEPVPCALRIVEPMALIEVGGEIKCISPSQDLSCPNQGLDDPRTSNHAIAPVVTVLLPQDEAAIHEIRAAVQHPVRQCQCGLAKTTPVIQPVTYCKCQKPVTGVSDW